MTPNQLPQTVVIAGGAGFIGSHLCDLFLSKGYGVLCVDNFVTGDLRNIEHLRNHPGFQLVKADLSERLDLPPVAQPIVGVLNFASPASPIDYLKLPLETLRVGSMGTQNALECARVFNARFIMASTSEVYGDPLVHPQPETYWGNVNSIGPRSVYDEAKRYSEALTMAYHRTFGLNTGIVRIFNTYGPRMRLNDGRAIPAFVSQALRGERITVFGDGSQTRSFCYISDLVEGIYRLFLSGEHLPVNLGNPNEMSILRLAEIVREKIGAQSPIGFEPLPTDDPKVRKPVIDRARQILGWDPKVSFEEGISQTLDYFRGLPLPSTPAAS